ncbi:PhzF family phenazine biosynthesis isomerase [Flavivirga sp. 57AJ16]|uniref:PhzF family phenazine biosynthesis isomerase n=1 Tax=Flavivirga sp. 57AJ16 TaxID=3025307 RepID=UPI0023669FF4|nr:PhzF family phenazine biosynthesis isomerase [Flavivirga sp. 57AJ16]MDD7886221.1 PhzF family phenazine biosynthesis isomerase [Flavivirga sp. 57AJ16]
MRKILNVYQVDVFTNEKFQGNPATVVWDSGKLPEDLMLKIAREFNNSETVFVCFNKDNLPPTLKYYTPTQEIDFCGHATIAAAFVFAKQVGNYGPIEFITNKNVVKVQVSNEVFYYGSYSAQMGEELNNSIQNRLLKILNLDNNSLDSKYPIQIVKSISDKLLILLKQEESLFDFIPDFNKLKAFQQCNNLPPIFLFNINSINNVESLICNGRMFAPTIGIDEDPVNGNSCIPLAKYLHHHKVVDNKFFNSPILCKQGESFHRKGTVYVDVNTNKKVEVNVGGTCTMAFKAIIKV